MGEQRLYGSGVRTGGRSRQGKQLTQADLLQGGSDSEQAVRQLGTRQTCRSRPAGNISALPGARVTPPSSQPSQPRIVPMLTGAARIHGAFPLGSSWRNAVSVMQD